MQIERNTAPNRSMQLDEVKVICITGRRLWWKSPVHEDCWDFVQFCGRTKRGGRAWTCGRCTGRRTSRRTFRCQSCAFRLGNPTHLPSRFLKSPVVLYWMRKTKKQKKTREYSPDSNNVINSVNDRPHQKTFIKRCQLSKRNDGGKLIA